MSVKLHSACKITQCVCKITQCAQNYTYSIGKKSSQLKNFTLTPWAAWATNISCAIQSHHGRNTAFMASLGSLSTPMAICFWKNRNLRFYDWLNTLSRVSW